ncbi:hypothetical protein AJ78_07993 [Emergomyces pasteurianus Ep9510]|uniref:Uncharacterized protein n=1 Tax=Emergomyces pasteurianus Ep9510 TaxID=1447872 RepID=A0A1J9PTI0_9EURO|nr:hypothetical protein AJ78_07993 [Emergomyces pasteurianus Ep9510]
MPRNQRPKPISVVQAQDPNASVPSPRRMAQLLGMPATPTVAVLPLQPQKIQTISPPDEANPTSKISKSEMVIAVPRAKADVVRNGDERPHSSLNTVSKPPAPTVSDPSDGEESRSQQKVSRSVASSSKGKEKEKLSSAEQAVEAVLRASASDPYQILDVPDPSELEVI